MPSEYTAYRGRMIANIMRQKGEYWRMSPAEKLESAVKGYRLHAINQGQAVTGKIRVRIVYFGPKHRPMFVVATTRSYIAAYSLDKLIERMAIGPWTRMREMGAVARRAFQ